MHDIHEYLYKMYEHTHGRVKSRKAACKIAIKKAFCEPISEG